MERDPVQAAIEAYAAHEPDLIAAGERFVALVTSILDEAGINYLSVTGRTKGVASFAAKAGRMVDGLPAFPDPLRDITDQIGVRVITYVHSDVSAVADLLADQVVVKDDRDLGQETASEGRFGYASRHLLIELDAARESDPAYADLRGRIAQVQVRTVLQHAWAEFEHDIRYKGTVPEEHARDLDRRFTLAAGLLELADQEFSTIRRRLRIGTPDRSEAARDDPRIDPRELAAFLAGQYEDAGWSRTDHYAWISGLLLELGITSLDELAEVVRGSGGEDLNARMGYRYPPGAVRRLDDALLATYGERYVALHGNSHRVDALRTRLEKLDMTAVVIGGANMDVKARSAAPVVAATSNPGHVVRSPGGVGRNVAENLSRLGTPTTLVAAVGTDALGDELLAATAAASVDVRFVRRVPGRTGTYVAVLDDAGELVVAVSDMAATESLAADDVRAAGDAIATAGLVVLDGNLPRDALTAGWDLAAAAGVPVVIDPVSVPKAAGLVDLLDGSRPLFAISPNLAELAVLGDAVDLVERGVELVWVRCGADGSRLVTSGGSTRLPSTPAEVVDVTGAGDAMLAAFCHGVLSGDAPVEAARLGHAAAALTVASRSTVRPDLREALG